MIDTINLNPPPILVEIEAATTATGFTMASDWLTGSLLRTLATTKPAGIFLELGTGTGMATAWLLAGMDAQSKLITVDNDPNVVAIAQHHLASDPRVTFYTMDGGTFLHNLIEKGETFDFIFADTWPGKYTHLEEALNLLKVGGLYIIDDMLPQPSWPEDHKPKAPRLIATLEEREDLRLTKLSWSTGLIIGVKAL
jgi:predicted O-methyltransferase YrrM